MLTITIGDVHGNFDKLTRLLEYCRRFVAGREAQYIFLGDYIDRGPDSRHVIEAIVAMQAGAPDRVLALLGNHEAMLFDALLYPDKLALWIRNGGDETLRSYGGTTTEAIPQEHLDWLASRPAHYDDGKRFFTHAGVRPGIPLDEQTPDDLLWIREPFLSSNVDYGRLIVHGHSPTDGPMPHISLTRVNLDTAAVFGGPLTAGVFSDAERNLIDVLQVS